MTRSAAHDARRLNPHRVETMESVWGDAVHWPADVAVRLKREPQFGTNRSTIINSLLRPTELIASKVRVGIHAVRRDYGLA